MTKPFDPTERLRKLSDELHNNLNCENVWDKRIDKLIAYAEAVGELHKPTLHLETMDICDVCMIVVDGKPNSVRYPCPTAKLSELLK